MKLSQLTYLILISLLVRMLLAAVLEFGNDEVYYYSYALHMQSNYFDHPPGVALLIRLSTLNLWLQSEFFVRLGSIICAALGTVLSYNIGSLIRNERTGLYAAVLYNTSIYTGIIAGVFILPDSPQVVFWLAGIMLALKIIIHSRNEKAFLLKYFILFGITCGICMLCKVHGIFIWFGFGAYILLFKRQLLLQPGLYLAVFLSVLIFSPVIIWNINNDFITWNFHSNRINTNKDLINAATFLRAFFGQIFYNNPVNVFLTAIALIYYKKKAFVRKDSGLLLLFTGLPIIILTSFMSLFNDVLPHWSGPGFLTLSFLGAAYLDSITELYQKKFPYILKASIILIVTIVVFGVSVIKFYPGTMGSKEIEKYGRNDFTLDMWGWKEFEKQFSVFLQQNKKLSSGSDLKIVCNKWFPAAHIDYYVARPLNAEVIGIGNIADLHHFAWLNKYRSKLDKGSNAICIVPSNYPEDVEAAYRNYFSSICLLQTFSLERSGKPAKYVSVYSLENYTGNHEVDGMVLTPK